MCDWHTPSLYSSRYTALSRFIKHNETLIHTVVQFIEREGPFLVCFKGIVNLKTRNLLTDTFLTAWVHISRKDLSIPNDNFWYVSCHWLTYTFLIAWVHISWKNLSIQKSHYWLRCPTFCHRFRMSIEKSHFPGLEEKLDDMIMIDLINWTDF